MKILSKLFPKKQTHSLQFDEVLDEWHVFHESNLVFIGSKEKCLSYVDSIKHNM
ncbi:hypothetical protein [Ekhidna sp.]